MVSLRMISMKTCGIMVADAADEVLAVIERVLTGILIRHIPDVLLSTASLTKVLLILVNSIHSILYMVTIHVQTRHVQKLEIKTKLIKPKQNRRSDNTLHVEAVA